PGHTPPKSEIRGSESEGASRWEAARRGSLANRPGPPRGRFANVGGGEPFGGLSAAGGTLLPTVLPPRSTRTLTAATAEPTTEDPHGYSARHLSVLEGLEAVRKRPGMYVGSTDSRGL